MGCNIYTKCKWQHVNHSQSSADMFKYFKYFNQIDIHLYVQSNRILKRVDSLSSLDKGSRQK